jgi:hypothetical protein
MRQLEEDVRAHAHEADLLKDQLDGQVGSPLRLPSIRETDRLHIAAPTFVTLPSASSMR